MLNLRHNLNGNSAEDLVAQLDAIREAARALGEALGGDFANGRNYQSLPNPIAAREQDFIRLSAWRVAARDIEEGVTATLVGMMDDDRVRRAWNARQGAA